jgi:replicative DNA helicase
MIDPLQTGLPQAAEAEQSILGAAMEGEGLFQHISAVLDCEDFSLEKSRRIYLAMASLQEAGAPINLVTVVTRLKDSGHLGSVGGMHYLASLTDGLASVTGIDSHLRIVKDKSILRRYVLGHQKLIDEALLNGDSAEILGRAEKFNRDLSAESARDRRLLTAAEIIDMAGGIDAFHKAVSPGIPTPWGWLTRNLGGWRPMELTILAARPSVGKTASALQIAETAGMHGISTAVFSLEMASKQLLDRMICSRAHVDSQKYRRRQLDREEWRRIGIATAEIAQLPIYYDDQTGCTVPAMHAAIRRLMASVEIGLVVIDYLQLMTAPGRHGNRTEAVSSISRGLKLATRDFGIPFIVLSQLTRSNEHDNRRPQLSDLRESGSIEQDADNVLFLHPKEKTFAHVRPVELIIGKQRNGDVGITEMVFMAQHVRLEETTDEEYRSRAAGE